MNESHNNYHFSDGHPPKGGHESTQHISALTMERMEVESKRPDLGVPYLVDDLVDRKSESEVGTYILGSWRSQVNLSMTSSSSGFDIYIYIY